MSLSAYRMSGPSEKPKCPECCVTSPGPCDEMCETQTYNIKMAIVLSGVSGMIHEAQAPYPDIHIAVSPEAIDRQLAKTICGHCGINTKGSIFCDTCDARYW